MHIMKKKKQAISSLLGNIRFYEFPRTLSWRKGKDNVTIILLSGGCGIRTHEAIQLNGV